MKSRNTIVCQSTARIIVLQLILVSVRVKSVCFEEDCTDQSIKVVDPTSGQCTTCFPCPQCEDGQTPSVPCGTTVPRGTDIHCVRTTPDPVVVSKASTYTTSLVLLATSPSVTPWQSSLTVTKQITKTAVKSYTHPVVVSATSSKNYGGSSSSAVNTDFEDLEKHGEKTAKDHKMGERTLVCLSFGVTLVVIFLGILWRFRKRKTIHSQQVHVSCGTTPMSCDRFSGTSHAANSDTCAVRIYPETNSVRFSCSYPEGGQQASKQGNDYEHFQRYLESPEENLVSATIPFSLDVTHAEAGEEKPQKLNPPTLSPKDQNTSTTGLYCPPSISPLTSVPQDFQSALLSRKMAEIPNKFYCKICTKLDILRPGFWNDYRSFGEVIGLDKDQVSWLGQTGTPTDKMIQEFDSQKNSSIAKFKEIMENMERYDVVSLIDEWIVRDWNICISSSAII